MHMHQAYRVIIQVALLLQQVRGRTDITQARQAHLMVFLRASPTGKRGILSLSPLDQ